MEFGLTQIWSDGWFGAIAKGALITVLVSIAAMALGLLIGTLCGLTKWSRVPVLHWLVDGYTSVIRGVPELLIIYLLFFSSVEVVTKIANAFGSLDVNVRKAAWLEAETIILGDAYLLKLAD